MAHIFVSYAIEDRQTANSICELLEGFGWVCWLAPRDILPGSDWGEAIIDAINQSQLMVLVYSDHAAHSVQIKREVERASSKGVVIAPFRVEDTDVSKSLEYHLSNCYWIDAISAPLTPHLERLKEVVSKLIGEPSIAVGAPPARNPALDGPPSSEIGLRHRSFPRRGFWQRARKKKIAAVAAILLIAVAGYFAWRRWSDPPQTAFDRHFNQSLTFYRNGEFDQAIEELNRALAASPANGVGYRSRGEVYAQRGRTRAVSSDLSLAVADYEMAIKLEPKDDVTYQLLGQVHINKREFDEALKYLTASLELNPRNVLSWTAKAYVHQQKREFESAAAALKKAYELAPDDLQVLGAIGDYSISRGDYENAVNSFTHAIRLRPDDPNLLLRRSAAYAGLGKYDEANDDKVEAQKLGNQKQ